MDGAADLTGIAIVAVAAVLCGMAMVRLHQPAIIGYILAGVILGPSGLSLVGNRETIDLLAQLGVIMLLFFIGMELSLRSFRTIWKIALITTLAQIGVSVGAFYLLGDVFGWPLEWAILFGFCLAMSSTAVAVKMLEDTGELRTRVGRIALGITIAQDLAVAPMLVVITNMAPEGGGSVVAMIFEVTLSIAILVGLILFLTRRQKVNLPFHRIISPNTDLKPLAAFALCFGFAAIAGLFGLSAAFGAFLAGLIVGNSAQRQEVHENAGPIQAILLMVFFLSIGLLIDLRFVVENIGPILGALAFVTVFKTALNVAILRVQGQSWQSAFSAALVIGQLGEFSFVMAAVALGTGVIGAEIHKMIVAVTVLSLILSPVMFDLHRRLRHRAAARVSSLRGLFRLAYVGETRLAKRASRAGIALAFRVATWLQVRIDRIRHAIRRRTGRTGVKPPTSKSTNAPKAPPIQPPAKDKTPDDARSEP